MLVSPRLLSLNDVGSNWENVISGNSPTGVLVDGIQLDSQTRESLTRHAMTVHCCDDIRPSLVNSTVNHISSRVDRMHVPTSLHNTGLIYDPRLSQSGNRLIFQSFCPSLIEEIAKSLLKSNCFFNCGVYCNNPIRPNQITMIFLSEIFFGLTKSD